MRARAGKIKRGGAGVKSRLGVGVRLPAAARRVQLLDVARRVFGRDGYRGASMESIAEAAGVTKPVLYQHFRSKHALYASLLESELSQLTADLERAFALAEGNQQRLRLGFGAYLDFVASHEDAFRLLFTEGLGLDESFQQRVDRFRSWVAERVTAIISAEAGLPAPRARALAVAIVGMAESAATWWLAEHRPLPIADLADELAGLAWQGFARYPASESESGAAPGAPAPPAEAEGMANSKGLAGTNRSETSPT
jgi:AcrR family transcriptional regulator